MDFVKLKRLLKPKNSDRLLHSEETRYASFSDACLQALFACVRSHIYKQIRRGCSSIINYVLLNLFYIYLKHPYHIY